MQVSDEDMLLSKVTLDGNNPTAGYSFLNGPYYPASGGADGSLLLSDEEISRQINDPMQNFRNFLLGKYKKYQKNVSAADFVQVAGSVGIKSCPGGPTVKTVSIPDLFRCETAHIIDGNS